MDLRLERKSAKFPPAHSPNQWLAGKKAGLLPIWGADSDLLGCDKCSMVERANLQGDIGRLVLTMYELGPIRGANLPSDIVAVINMFVL